MFDRMFGNNVTAFVVFVLLVWVSVALGYVLVQVCPMPPALAALLDRDNPKASASGPTK